MKRFAIGLAAVCIGAGCGSEGGETTVSLENDYLLPPSEVLPQSAPRGGTTTLYLNFDGEEIKHSGFGSDATKNQSFIVPNGGSTIPAFETADVCGENGSDREVLIEMLRAKVAEKFAPYDVDVVTERPSSGSYEMVMIGGTSGAIGYPNTNWLGLAPLDCSNHNGRDIGFVFSAIFGCLSTNTLVQGIAHESGHFFGSPHSPESDDTMFWMALGKDAWFLDKHVDMNETACGFSEMNVHELLEQNLGAIDDADDDDDDPNSTSLVDLAVTSLTVTTKVKKHAKVKASATVCNLGTEKSSKVRTALYFDHPGVPVFGATPDKDKSFGGLGAGKCRKVSFSLGKIDVNQLPATVWLRVDSEGVLTEQDESNNLSSGAQASP